MTVQVGRHGRSVAEIAADLGCSWRAVMDAVVAVGEQVIGHPDRIGAVTALGLDETSFAKVGRFGTQLWSTQIVEVRRLGRTITHWATQIIAWHRSHVTNGPTEAINDLAKGIRRVAFGLVNFRHHRIHCLLYAGRPD